MHNKLFWIGVSTLLTSLLYILVYTFGSTIAMAIGKPSENNDWTVLAASIAALSGMAIAAKTQEFDWNGTDKED